MGDIIAWILFISFYLFFYFIFLRVLYLPGVKRKLWENILIFTPINVPFVFLGLICVGIEQSDWYCYIRDSIDKKYKNIRRKILYKELYEKMRDIDPYSEEIWEE